jgi:hypothetical protein
MAIAAYGYGVNSNLGLGNITNVFIDDVQLSLNADPEVVFEEENAVITVVEENVSVTVVDSFEIEVD